MNFLDIINKIRESGFEAYVVGGAVRDMLLNTTIKDVDIVTDAEPHEVTKIFIGEKVTLTGVSFRVVLVNGYEIASFRSDEYKGFSDKNVVISKAKTIEEDLGRRDLTINSMAYDVKEKKLIDPYNGRKDLMNKTIRFNQQAKQRIIEDPNRIIRACRFLAKLQGTFDKTTFDALRTHSHLIPKCVAPERIRIEILKVLRYPYPGMFFAALQDIHALKYVLPSLAETMPIGGGPHHKDGVFFHSISVGNHISRNRPLLKLAGYLHDVGKTTAYKVERGKISFIDHEAYSCDLVQEDLTALKFSNGEVKFITNLIKYHMRSVNEKTSDKTIRRLLHNFQKDNVHYMDYIRLRIADRKGNGIKDKFTRKQIKAMILKFEKQLTAKEDRAITLKDLKVDGNDVMKILNIKPGKLVGEILKLCNDKIIDNPKLNNVESLTELIIGYGKNNITY